MDRTTLPVSLKVTSVLSTRVTFRPSSAWRRGTSGLREELRRVRLRARGGSAAEHARELVLAGGGRELADVGLGAAGVLGLLDVEVVIGERGDLRQVGDAQHLA